MHKEILQFILFLCYSTIICSQGRTIINLDNDWHFNFSHDAGITHNSKVVELPHTWNAHEVMEEKPYTRTAAVYRRILPSLSSFRNKRIFMRFEGVNSVAYLLINKKMVGRHFGGYTAFCFEITDHILQDRENEVLLHVSNAYRMDVLPLSGDFNVYGGIHRPVSLIITEKNCITPLDYASPGVYITQKFVSRQSASIEVKTKLSLQGKKDNCSVETTLTDQSGNVIFKEKTPVHTQETKQFITLAHPHLWQGRKDPYLYQLNIKLYQKEKVIDGIIQPLGLRSYRVYAEKGFFLNGEYLDLKGVCRHEDMQDKGSALTMKDTEADIALIDELGATAVRLTHYPQSDYFYQLCDKRGFIVWSEIPLVGPGGYGWTGYVRDQHLHLHTKQILKEMIRQYYNHPSICFWGLFNELKTDFDNPEDFVKELYTLAKEEDSTRLTTLATFLSDSLFNGVSDLMAWNKYYGWYGGSFRQMGTWADTTHKKLLYKPIAIGEYGAGGSIKQHQDSLVAPVAASRWHPENWQAFYHEQNWKELNKRPFLWGKFIWLLSDFGSHIRKEGDTIGINDKGLVTYDRAVKKDAFYFYKANWNPKPVLYITNRRFYNRRQKTTTVKVYSNLEKVELVLNDKNAGFKNPDEYKIAEWENIHLAEGKNTIKVKGYNNEKLIIEDSCEWFLIK